jgi:hypothetical protein
MGRPILFFYFCLGILASITTQCTRSNMQKNAPQGQIIEHIIPFVIGDSLGWVCTVDLPDPFYANRDVIAEMRITDVENPSVVPFYFDTEFKGITKSGRKVSSPLGYYGLYPANAPSHFLVPLGKSCAKASGDDKDPCEAGKIIITMLPSNTTIPLQQIRIKGSLYLAANP